MKDFTSSRNKNTFQSFIRLRHSATSPWCVALKGAKPADVKGGALEENTPPHVLISACHTIAQTESFVVDFKSTFFKTKYVILSYVNRQK